SLALVRIGYQTNRRRTLRNAGHGAKPARTPPMMPANRYRPVSRSRIRPQLGEGPYNRAGARNAHGDRSVNAFANDRCGTFRLDGHGAVEGVDPYDPYGAPGNQAAGGSTEER